MFMEILRKAWMEGADESPSKESENGKGNYFLAHGFGGRNNHLPGRKDVESCTEF